MAINEKVCFAYKFRARFGAGFGSSRLQDKDSLMAMACQGAREEPEARPGGPGDLKIAWGGSSLGLLPLLDSPGLPSGSSWAPWQSIKLILLLTVLLKALSTVQKAKEVPAEPPMTMLANSAPSESTGSSEPQKAQIEPL